ncbi:lytic murein transglycosylase [Phyllobacterium phragmitis]|uniref:Lytic murein transglycosylase n=1 Tax=Phyllobacterium phragmitis TaxID=2670329 RepID=A0A2S9IUL1_9HYPH|nr:lytic murein transglycosylase [Phyllobacterium phragmitis]
MESHCDLTPLWLASHLPLKGGDYAFMNAWHQSHTLQNKHRALRQLISPLEGEMPGKAEGGVRTQAIPSKQEPL